MTPLIVIGGAPGTGKTTITRLLHAHFQSVMLDFGWLRQFHLDPEWRKASPVEEDMAFENLLFILRNYLRHGYTRILLNDLQDQRIQAIPQLFAPDEYMIVTLVVRDEAVLTHRVLDPDRDSGYRDFRAAIAWNQRVLKRARLPNEYLLDNTDLAPDAASQRILDLIVRHTPPVFGETRT